MTSKVLIIDSGATSTKCLCSESPKGNIISLSGINPNLHDDIYISNVIADLKVKIPYDLDKIFYYGAGCSTESNIKRIATILERYFNNAEISIYNDLMASAHALLGKQPGIVAILGTGSNAGFFDGNSLIKLFPSLGYLLGDEGSATHIGKSFLKDLLYDKVPYKLSQIYLRKLNKEKSELISYIYSLSQPNSFFADSAAFITRFNTESYANNLIFNCFNEFVIQHILPLSEKYEIKNVSFSGSIACLNENILKKVINLHNLKLLKIIQNPLEGLCKFYNC